MSIATSTGSTRRRGFGDVRAFWLFVVGTSVAVDISIMGRVMGPDILCSVGLIGLLASRAKLEFAREAKVFIAMVSLWLLGAVITDLIRQTSMDNVVRGWFKICFFTITFVYIYLASQGRLFRIICFLAGLSLGELATFLREQNEYLDSAPWKFGYGPTITLFAVILISTPFFRRIFGLWGQVAAIVFMAAVNLKGDSRSVFGILLATVFIVVAGNVFKIMLRGRRVPKPIFVLFLVGGVIFSQGVVALYGVVASSGLLGAQALEKYEMQTSGDTGLLLSGRAESLVSTHAIADSPIIGHGSWASDYKYINLYAAILEKRGLPYNFSDPFANPQIPSHSFLFGAWVESGILGGLFWIYVLVVSGRSLYSLIHIPEASRPIVTFIVLLLMWDVLFSPFGAQERFIAPAEICVVLWAIRNERVGKPARSIVGVRA